MGLGAHLHSRWVHTLLIMVMMTTTIMLPLTVSLLWGQELREMFPCIILTDPCNSFMR